MKELVLKYRIVRQETKTISVTDEEYAKIISDDVSGLEKLEDDLPEGYREETIQVYHEGKWVGGY